MMGTTEVVLASLCLVAVGVLVVVLILLIRRSGSSRSSAGPDPFHRAEGEYQRLRAQFEARELTEEDFKARLKSIMVQDKSGNWWTLGYETGQWYRHDGTNWTPAEPPSPQTSAQDTGRTQSAISNSIAPRQRAWVFIVGLLALLTVPGICGGITYGLITGIGGDYDLATILSVVVAALILIIGIVLLVIAVRRINRPG